MQRSPASNTAPSGVEQSASPLVEARKLLVGYGAALLPALDLAIRPGDFWVLVGPNGGGKTTLLRTLLGLQAPVGGSVTRAANARFSYVSQRPELDSTVPARVIDLVRSGLEHDLSFMIPRYGARRRREVELAMARTHTVELADVQYLRLSEGQKQRVRLAQAIVSHPALVALDEPTSAMDAMAEARTFELLDELRRSRGFAVLLITHDLHHLASRASHAVAVDKDRGHAVAGTVDEVLRHE